MRNYSSLFSRDRKILYVILSIVLVSMLTLTVVYAALSTTLNINGNAEISAASWDIYLDNVVLNNQSVTTSAPIIIDSRTASFTTTLSKPGDFYEFTIDVVNNGSIDAMIDSVTKTPELSATQKKYLNYVVEYQNGEAITTKQLISKNSFVRLKVKVSYHDDISPSDLPTQDEMLNLAFVINYVQSDESGTNVKDNGIKRKALDVISGDLDTIGSEVAIGNEHFNILSVDDSSITIFAKYNLYIGNECNLSTSICTPYGSEATGLQDPTMLGMVTGQNIRKGTVMFASTQYWTGSGSVMYVYDSNSELYGYIENYKAYLKTFGYDISDARLISVTELEALGCNRTEGNCHNAPEWIYTTTYWTGNIRASTVTWYVDSNGYIYYNSRTNASLYGVRPVIVVLK